VQDELVEARNRLAHAIAGAATSGLTQDEIVDLTGYLADLALRICCDAGIGEAGSALSGHGLDCLSRLSCSCSGACPRTDVGQ
jgi:hypothetical protein